MTHKSEFTTSTSPVFCITLYTWLTEVYRPHVRTKYRALEFKWRYGGRSQRKFAQIELAKRIVFYCPNELKMPKFLTLSLQIQ